MSPLPPVLPSSVRREISRADFFSCDELSISSQGRDTIFAINKYGSMTFISSNQREEELRIRRQRSSSVACPRSTDTSEEILWRFSYGKQAPTIDEEVALKFPDPVATSADYIARRNIMEGKYTPDMIHRTEDVPENQRTTVMMRNLPNKLDRTTLLQLLEIYGYANLYDFFHLPIDQRSKSNTGYSSKGYAFINFIEPRYAQSFRDCFTGFDAWGVNSTKKCEVCWSSTLQGLAAHVDRYRSSPLIRESVPFEFRPCLFINGEPAAFLSEVVDERKNLNQI